VVQSSNDELLRYMGVDSEPVNHGWLCDRGRVKIESVKSDARVLQPMVRNGDTLEPTSWSNAFAEAATLIQEAKAVGGVQSIAIIGGARGTNEDAFTWARLGHEVIGTPNVYSQMGDGLPVGLLGLNRATIDDAASATTIILLGPDLKEELPVLYLRLREAAEKKRSKIIEFSPKLTGLSNYAWRQVGYEPGTQVSAVQTALADETIAAQLAKGNVVIVAGRANLAESSAATIAALHTLLAAAPDAKVLPAFRRGNVVGALQVGFRPGKGGLDTRGTLQAAADGKIDCLVLLGADPLTDFPDTDLARRALAGARRIIAIDTFLTASSSLANVVLAASAYGEKAGTTTNVEGRVSTVARQVTPAGSTRPDWMIATELALELGVDLGYGSVEDVTADIASKVDGFAAVTAEALAADSNGVLAGVPTGIDPINSVEVVVSDRNSYDFRLVVSRHLYDEAVGTAMSPSLAHLSRGSVLHLHPLDIERVGTTAGTDVKVIGPRATVIFSTVADESVLRGTAFVPFNNPGPNVGDLIDCFAAVNDVRIENL
jgi:NADH-quinone oxidoreductase subunit G